MNNIIQLWRPELESILGAAEQAHGAPVTVGLDDKGRVYSAETASLPIIIMLRILREMVDVGVAGPLDVLTSLRPEMIGTISGYDYPAEDCLGTAVGLPASVGGALRMRSSNSWAREASICRCAARIISSGVSFWFTIVGATDCRSSARCRRNLCWN